MNGMSIVINAVANYAWHVMMENVIPVQVYLKTKEMHKWLQCLGADTLSDGKPSDYRCKICGFRHILDHTFFDDYEYLRRFAEYWGDMHGLKSLYAFLEKPWHYVNELPDFFEWHHIEANNEEQW